MAASRDGLGFLVDMFCREWPTEPLLRRKQGVSELMRTLCRNSRAIIMSQEGNVELALSHIVICLLNFMVLPDRFLRD